MKRGRAETASRLDGSVQRVDAQRRSADGYYPVAAIAMGLMLAGAVLPTPLFPLYHRAWNLSTAEISLVFAVYASSLIPSLLFLGGLSDTLGRRRTILLAFGLLAASAVVFICAHGLPWLVGARIVQGIGMGIGTGAAASAIRDWMHEPDRARAGMVTVVSAGLGTAFGALLGGIFGQYAPWPFVLPYLAYIVLLSAGALAVAMVPELPAAAARTRNAILTVPKAILRPFGIAAAESFIGWSTFAIFIALVPTYLARALDVQNLLVGASLVALMQLGMLCTTPAARRLSSRTSIVLSMAGVGIGVWVLLLAIAMHAVALVLLASFVAGSGAGLSYLAGLNIVNAIASPQHRAETISAYMLVCYTGYSAPALALGIAATRYGLDAAFYGAASVLVAGAIGVSVLASERNLSVGPEL